MRLLYIIAGLVILLTLISGQYGEHVILFWTSLGATATTGFLYSVQRRIMADPSGQGKGTFLALELGIGVCGYATLGLFIWLCVVIWM